MRTVLVVPDGMGIRNFLCTGFVNHLLELNEESRVLVWHALPAGSLEELRAERSVLADPRVEWRPLPPWREGLAERIFRQAKVLAQLEWRRDADAGRLQMARRQPSKRLRDRLVTRAAKLLGRAAGRLAEVRGAAWVGHLHHRAAGRSRHLTAFRETLRAEAPDVVFCTHQRASRAVPAMVAARELKIPTATFVYSWDNLPKGRMAVPADRYLVWSERMAGEMATYYPELADGRVEVVGTPQFEPAVAAVAAVAEPQDEADRAALRTRLGLDPDRPVVCFSGDDVATSPHDPLYLRDLARALREIPEATRPQLLFRRCPVDLSDRYDDVLAAHPEIVVSDPLWRLHPGDWSAVVPSPADTRLLVDVTRAADLVVNLGSTMALDFALAGHPAVYLAYDPVPDQTPGPTPGHDWRVDDIYRLPHFEIVHRLDPVHWARSADELGPAVRHALAHPDEKKAAREAWLREIAQHPLGDAGYRTVQALARLAESGASP